MKKFNKDRALLIIICALLVLFDGFLIHTGLYAIFAVHDIRVNILGAWVLLNTVISSVDGFLRSFKEEDQ